MKPDAADNSVPREISALLSKERLILRGTGRAVTPLGGVAVFVAFLHELGSVEKLRQYMPIQCKSPNQIDPTTSSVEDEVALRAEPAVVAEGRGSRGGVLLGSERQKQPSRADFEGAQTSGHHSEQRVAQVRLEVIDSADAEFWRGTAWCCLCRGAKSV
jgi:hypothetical protein